MSGMERDLIDSLTSQSAQRVRYEDFIDALRADVKSDNLLDDVILRLRKHVSRDEKNGLDIEQVCKYCFPWFKLLCHSLIVIHTTFRRFSQRLIAMVTAKWMFTSSKQHLIRSVCSVPSFIFVNLASVSC